MAAPVVTAVGTASKAAVTIMKWYVFKEVFGVAVVIGAFGFLMHKLNQEDKKDEKD